ncbi:MAG TPA: HEAT repeat domain-containing protein [Terriglobales bacterium]|nr:HEAT repeat domain-containing protein [Terriglobales bacterium]
MSKVSKAGAIFLGIFALPFLGMGIAAMIAFQSNPQRLGANAATAFAACFVLLGIALIYGAISGYRNLSAMAKLQAEHPNSPWLWRADWQQSRTLGQKRNTAVGLWMATVLGGGLLSLLGSSILNTKTAKDAEAGFAFLCAFGVAEVLLLFFAIRATLGRERYGKTYFEFDSLPFTPGAQLTGHIHLRLPVYAQHGFTLRLSCLRRVITGSGKNQSTHNFPLWQQEQNVATALLGTGDLGTTIPVSFSLPGDAYETNNDNLRDRVLWTLHAQADVPGVDFSEDYELPVFRLGDAAKTGNSSRVFQTAFGASAAVATAPAAVADDEPIQQPAKVSCQITRDWNGTKFYFPPFRNPAQSLVMVGVLIAWSAAVYALSLSRAPLFFTIIFGLVDLILLIAVPRSIFSSITIRLGSDTLTLQRSFLDLGQPKSIAFSDIAGILPVAGQGSGSKAYYSLRLSTKNGKQWTLVNGITDRQEARWLVTRLESLAGLKQDAHVAIDSYFGPTPQRGTPSVTVTQKGAPWVAWVIGPIWLLLVLSVALVPMLKVGRSPARRQVTHASAAPLQPRKFSPMNNADTRRISSLPAQDQAEELLERSLGHDERSLNLLNQQMPGWNGAVKSTARLQQLLERARYSGDLRVRYAYCDLSLLADGLDKDEQTVQRLIADAKKNPSSRAYDVWSLGLLGSRGVDVEQAHTALLDYAHNDSSVQVRQWAVEALGLLGTDEALNELFEFFSTDPSLAVRDRAGCNLSGCGNFTRRQRMTIFPKILAIAEDPKTAPQVRNWAFLAMGEITNVGLPSDATAWRRWYDEHGPEKQAEFASLPEWRVRGE